MFTCKECGKKFKSMQALGGHVGRAHPRNKVEEQPQSEDQQAEAPVPEESPPEAVLVQQEPKQLPKPPEDEEGIMENIRRLRRQGYTARQVKEQFGYARSTVDQVYAEVFKPEGKPEEEREGEGGEAGLPVTVKGTEIVTPEYIMRTLANGSEDWRLRLEGMMLLRAAQRMNRDDIEMTRMQAEADATRIKPILELMKETRLEQDAAAQRAKESSIEIADRAAYETASQLSQVISQNNARITDSINQIRQAMGGKEENPLTQILNSIQSMQQLMQMFGITMPGMAPGAAQGGGPPAESWQPPPITRRKRSEKREGGEDVRSTTEDDGNPASP